MANLIIEDLRRSGSLQIPRVGGEYRSGSLTEHFQPRLNLPWQGGSYSVPNNVREAILENPEFFRAGALGPDMFPDMLFGQGVIHPEYSGVWLEFMFEEFKKISSLDPKHKEIHAFLLGQMMHYCGDLFGHGYVNEHAGGWFPSITSIMESGNVQIMANHMKIESYMDKKVPANTPTSIKIPTGFLYDCFANKENLSQVLQHYIKNRRLDENARKRARETIEMMPLWNFVVERDKKFEKSQDSTTNMVDFVNYNRGWYEDCEKSLIAWIEMWGKIAQDNIKEFSKDSFERHLKNWARDYYIYTTFLPGWLIDSAKFINGLTDFLPDIINPFAWIGDIIKGMVMAYLLGLAEKIAPALTQLVQELMAPLDPAIQARLDADFKNFGQTSDTMNQQFRAFSECLTMCKLCLISPNNLNNYFNIPSVSDSKFMATYNDRHLRRLRVKIKTSTAKWAGTDDNVYFELFTTFGRKFSFLFDKKWYNDFERGDKDVYYCTLPCAVPYGSLWAYGFRKDYIVFSDDWKVASVYIEDADTGVKLCDHRWETWVKGKKLITRTFPRNLGCDDGGDKIIATLDSRFITWDYHSLDGKGMSDQNPAINLPWEKTDFALYQYLSRKAISHSQTVYSSFENKTFMLHLERYGQAITASDMEKITPVESLYRSYYLNMNCSYEGGQRHHELHRERCRQGPAYNNMFLVGRYYSAVDAFENSEDALLEMYTSKWLENNKDRLKKIHAEKYSAELKRLNNINEGTLEERQDKAYKLAEKCINLLITDKKDAIWELISDRELIADGCWYCMRFAHSC